MFNTENQVWVNLIYLEIIYTKNSYIQRIAEISISVTL